MNLPVNAPIILAVIRSNMKKAASPVLKWPNRMRSYPQQTEHPYKNPAKNDNEQHLVAVFLHKKGEVH